MVQRDDIVDVSRDEGSIELSLSDGGVIHRSLGNADIISSLEYTKLGTNWKKVEAIYYDPLNGKLKVVYKE